jgi:hypothetical protein
LEEQPLSGLKREVERVADQIQVLAKIKSKMYQVIGSIFIVPQTDDELYWLTHLARTSVYQVVADRVVYRDFPLCSVVSIAMPLGGPRAFALATMESEMESEVERLRMENEEILRENQELLRENRALYAEIDRLRRARDIGGVRRERAGAIMDNATWVVDGIVVDAPGTR